MSEQITLQADTASLHPQRLSDQSPGATLNNAQVNETLAAFLGTAAQQGGTQVAGINQGLQAGLTATLNFESPSAVQQAIQQAVGQAGVTGSNVSPCVQVVQAVLAALGYQAQAFNNQFSYCSVTALVLNNTVYQLTNSEDYVNDGDVSFAPGSPLAPVSTPQAGQMVSLGIYGFQQGSFTGPSGAVSLAIEDTNTGNSLGTVDFAYSDPMFSGSNGCGVNFDQTLAGWFSGWNGSGGLTASATLPAQTVNSTPYPAMNAYAGLDATSGTTPLMVVVVSA